MSRTKDALIEAEESRSDALRNCQRDIEAIRDAIDTLEDWVAQKINSDEVSISEEQDLWEIERSLSTLRRYL